MTVFYEVLCPDSRHFILRQLHPTWEKVSEIMDINYRPFGKAHVSNFSHFKQCACKQPNNQCYFFGVFSAIPASESPKF